MKKKFNEIFNETVQKKQTTNEAWWDKMDNNQIAARYGAFRDNNRRNVGAIPEYTETESEKRQREYFENQTKHNNQLAIQQLYNVSTNDKISQREKVSLLLDYAQTIKRELTKDHKDVITRATSNMSRLGDFLDVLQMIFDANEHKGQPEFRVTKGTKVYDLGYDKDDTSGGIVVYPRQDYIKDEFGFAINKNNLKDLQAHFVSIIRKANDSSKFKKTLSDYEKIQENEFQDAIRLIRRIPELQHEVLRETYEPLASEYESNLIFGDLLENISDINLLEMERDQLTGEPIGKKTKLTTRAGNVNKANELAIRAANDPNLDPSTKGRIKNNAIAAQTQYNIEKNQANRDNQTSVLEENDQVEAIKMRMENDKEAFQKKMNGYQQTIENIQKNDKIKQKAQNAANANSTKPNGVEPAYGNLGITK